MTTPERIGREEGLAEGLAKGLAKGIEVALESKFGEAGLRLMPEIRAIEDEAKLESVLRAVHTAASPEDLRRVWTD
jgi:predicted transposase YdaD